MPELPEVETIRLGLQKYLVGKKVERVEIRLPKIFEGDSKKLVGAQVTRVRRFGKALVVDFDPMTGSGQAFSLAVHVKMTGQLIFRPKVGKVGEVRNVGKVGRLPNAFTHVIFHLDGEDKLYYNGMRQFGWLRVLHTPDVGKMKFISELGPEPIIENSKQSKSKKGLTLEIFRQILEGKSTAIKVLLMDQKRIGGVGNIYANDALYLAGINPKRLAGSLSLREQSKLHETLHEVLKKGLELGGSSEHTYVNALGGEGEYQKHFLVYGKIGKKCEECGTIIKRISLGGRGTFFLWELSKMS